MLTRELGSQPVVVGTAPGGPGLQAVVTEVASGHHVSEITPGACSFRPPEVLSVAPKRVCASPGANGRQPLPAGRHRAQRVERGVVDAAGHEAFLRIGGQRAWGSGGVENRLHTAASGLGTGGQACSTANGCESGENPPFSHGLGWLCPSLI